VLTIKVDTPSCVDPVKKLIKSVSAKARLVEGFGGQMEFDLPDDDLQLSQVFSLIEGKKQIYTITDYSLSQHTLEDVFLGLAKKQKKG